MFSKAGWLEASGFLWHWITTYILKQAMAFPFPPLNGIKCFSIVLSASNLYSVAQSQLTFWHKKEGLKLNTLVLYTKQTVCYVFVTFDRQHLEGCHVNLQDIVYDSQYCQKLGQPPLGLLLWFYPEPVGNFCMSILSSILRGRNWELSCDECTGHGIPDTRK